jgi:hypothetical protein
MSLRRNKYFRRLVWTVFFTAFVDSNVYGVVPIAEELPVCQTTDSGLPLSIAAGPVTNLKPANGEVTVGHIRFQFDPNSRQMRQLLGLLGPEPESRMVTVSLDRADKHVAGSLVISGLLDIAHSEEPLFRYQWPNTRATDHDRGWLSFRARDHCALKQLSAYQILSLVFRVSDGV